MEAWGSGVRCALPCLVCAPSIHPRVSFALCLVSAVVVSLLAYVDLCTVSSVLRAGNYWTDWLACSD